MSNEPYYELNTKDIRIIHNKREVKFLPHIHNSVEIIYLFSGIQHLIINEQTYILNTNTNKFHLPDCSGVRDIKEKNREEYTGTREEILKQGYEPCGRCHP